MVELLNSDGNFDLNKYKWYNIIREVHDLFLPLFTLTSWAPKVDKAFTMKIILKGILVFVPLKRPDATKPSQIVLLDIAFFYTHKHTHRHTLTHQCMHPHRHLRKQTLYS